MVGVRELRIHGVGGSPGAQMLGVCEQDAVVLRRGRHTQFLARRHDPQVEGYDWGRLTTDSRYQPLWVLLLPFTLINVAGWTHGHFSGGIPRIRLIRAMVHLSAVLLSAGYVLWTAIALVDYLGYQGLGQLGEQARIIAVVGGVVLTVSLTVLLMVIANITRRRYERVDPEQGPAARTGRAYWGVAEKLSSGQFFAHDRSLRVLLLWHAVVITTTLLLVVSWVWFNWGQPNLGLGRIFLVLGFLQFLVIVVLAVVSWNSRGRFPGQAGPRALPAAGVTLSVALSNGFWGGFVLLIVHLAGVEREYWGQELALMEAFVIVVLCWAAVLMIWRLTWRGQGDADELPERTTSTDQEPDGVDMRLRGQVAAARGRASAHRLVPRLLSVFAGLFLLSAVGAGLFRLQPEGPVLDWLQPPQPGVLSTAAAVLLPALTVAAMLVVWRSAGNRLFRGPVAIIWDVLTFWPRRFHPLAVRPYTERAVPELQSWIIHRTRTEHGLILSAHSQGSVLAFAALAPMGSGTLQRCGLLSFGSPITTFYGQVFPAYFGQEAVLSMQRGLGSPRPGWINLYRLTDAIGGPVIGFGEPSTDIEVPDPAESPSSICYGEPTPAEPWKTDMPSTGLLHTGSAGAELLSPDPEPLRPVWADVAGHSDYENECIYKQSIARLRRLVQSATQSRGEL